MKVEKNKVVSMTYTLKFDNADGDLIEKVSEVNPLEVLIGNENLFDKFEEALINLSIGDNFEFTLQPEEAYGNYEEEKQIAIPRENFVIDGKFDEEIIKEGAIIPMADEEGDTEMEAIVTAVDETNVHLDFNHPLAGEVLHFTGKIINVREATADEIENGDIFEEEDDEEE